MIVAAWWSFYVRAWSRRRLRVKHLRALEVLLGHRIQVTRIERQKRRPGVYLVEAWSNIDTPTVERAAMYVLRQVSRFTSSVRQSQCLLFENDEEEDDLVAFYWDEPELTDLPGFVSSGVLLKLWPDDPGSDWAAAAGPADRICMELVMFSQTLRSRPLMVLQPIALPLRKFVMDLDIHVQCSTKEKLVQRHWPAFLEHRLGGEAELIAIETRSFDQGPFKVHARRHLECMADDQAIGHCLALTGGKRLVIECDPSGRLIRLSATTDPPTGLVTGIVGYTVRPAAE